MVLCNFNLNDILDQQQKVNIFLNINKNLFRFCKPLLKNSIKVETAKVWKWSKKILRFAANPKVEK